MYNKNYDLKYDFSREAGTDDSITIESAYVTKNRILKIAPKWFDEAEQIDGARGVLALAQFLQSFAQYWLTDQWNEYCIIADELVDFEQVSAEEKQLWQNWKSIILLLQKSIWERSKNYLNFENTREESEDSKLQLESMLELYKNYTIPESSKSVEDSEQLEYFKFTKPSNILNLYPNDQNSILETIQKAHILDKPKYILEILSLWKSGKIEVTFEQFNLISEILIEISKVKIDDRWKTWFIKFYRPGRDNDSAILEAELAWYESLKSLKSIWSNFAKLKFLSDEELSKIKHQQLPAYRSIDNIAQSNLAAVEKNGKKIAISGKFGIDTAELVSALESQGYEVLDKLSKDCDFVLIGFDDYKTLFKAKKYLVRRIDFLDLIKMLTNRNYQID